MAEGAGTGWGVSPPYCISPCKPKQWVIRYIKFFGVEIMVKNCLLLCVAIALTGCSTAQIQNAARAAIGFKSYQDAQTTERAALRVISVREDRHSIYPEGCLHAFAGGGKGHGMLTTELEKTGEQVKKTIGMPYPRPAISGLSNPEFYVPANQKVLLKLTHGRPIGYQLSCTPAYWLVSFEPNKNYEISADPNTPSQCRFNIHEINESGERVDFSTKQQLASFHDAYCTKLLGK